MSTAKCLNGDALKLLPKVQSGSVNLLFADVPAFPGYRVGSDGSVWSRRKSGNGAGFANKWRKLKPRSNAGGYLYVSLRVRGATVNCAVHRLVLASFVGPAGERQQALHQDGNPANNQLSNLRWGTQSENEKDKERHGTANRLGGAKIDRETAQVIRRRVASGETQSVLAAEYGITASNVSVIVSGRTWRHSK